MHQLIKILVLIGIALSFSSCDLDDLLDFNEADCKKIPCQNCTKENYVIRNGKHNLYIVKDTRVCGRELERALANNVQEHKTFLYGHDDIFRTNYILEPFADDYICLDDDVVDNIDTLSNYITGSVTDSRDGELYSTIKIGSQNWMAENLRYDAPGSWYNLENPNPSYGRLYPHHILMKSGISIYDSGYIVQEGAQGLCPNGWHVPSDEEWKLLEKAIGMSEEQVNNSGDRNSRGYDLSTKIRSNQIVRRTVQDRISFRGTNVSGLSVLPAGSSRNGVFATLGFYATFWTSSQRPDRGPWARTITPTEIKRSSYGMTSGLSCRCVED